MLLVLRMGGRRAVAGQPIACPLADVAWSEPDEHGRQVRFAAMPLAELLPVALASGAGEVTVGVPMGRFAAGVLRRFAPLLLPILGRLQRKFHDGLAPAAGAFVSRVWATAEAEDGATVSARFETGEAYAFAARAAIRAVEAVLAGDSKPGAWTPTAAFGAGFLRSIDGVRIVDL